MRRAVWAGVDIGGTKTAVVLSPGLPRVMCRKEFPTLAAKGPERVLNLIVSSIRNSLAAQGLRAKDLKAIGVSCGSPQDSKAGIIQAPPNLWTWVDVPIKSILESEFGAPCHLENDANACAIAEHRYGAGKGTRDMVFLTMGTGFGAGIITGGRLYRGASDMAGEIGHVRLSRLGPVGCHKAGSVEGWASGSGLSQVATRAAADYRKRGQPTLLAKCLARNGIVTAQDVADAVLNGDALARRLVRATGRRLGETLAILVDVLNPELIVIGGLAMRFGDDLLQPALAVMSREALPGSAAVCRVVPAALGERVGDIAALCVAKCR